MFRCACLSISLLLFAPPLFGGPPTTGDDPDFVRGFALAFGLGMSADGPQAEELLRAAADRGNAQAMATLANIYIQGPDGVAQDIEQSVKWGLRSAEGLELQAKRGDPRAQYLYGWINQFGLASEGKPDYAAARIWYRKSSIQNFALGSYGLHVIYHEGLGITKNPSEAMKWLTSAAEQGYAKAQTKLGGAFATGDALDQKNLVEAVAWYRKAAEQGEKHGQFLLGYALDNGDGVPAKDRTEALKWYRLAAEQGLEPAQMNLGVAYLFANDMEKNAVEGVKWTRKAAEQGNGMAQVIIGIAYQTGDGVKQDAAEAAKWYRKTLANPECDDTWKNIATKQLQSLGEKP